jgi:hypothetical protein
MIGERASWWRAMLACAVVGAANPASAFLVPVIHAAVAFVAGIRAVYRQTLCCVGSPSSAARNAAKIAAGVTSNSGCLSPRRGQQILARAGRAVPSSRTAAGQRSDLGAWLFSVGSW